MHMHSGQTYCSMKCLKANGGVLSEERKAKTVCFKEER